jgi:thymidylate synthase
MRAVDCFGKLLMNVNEFAALQRYVALRLNKELGGYTHFIDSLHFNMADKEAVLMLLAKK